MRWSRCHYLVGSNALLENLCKILGPLTRSPTGSSASCTSSSSPRLASATRTPQSLLWQVPSSETCRASPRPTSPSSRTRHSNTRRSRIQRSSSTLCSTPRRLILSSLTRRNSSRTASRLTRSKERGRSPALPTWLQMPRQVLSVECGVVRHEM